MQHTVSVICAIEHKDKFLVVKRSEQESENPGKWVLPGGKVEQDENPVGALFREIQEEVAITIHDSISVIRLFSFLRRDNTSSICIVFVGKYKKGNIVLDKSLTDYRWVNLEEYKILDTVKGSHIHIENALMAIKDNLLVKKEILANFN